jgi:hypothetical protein
MPSEDCGDFLGLNGKAVGAVLAKRSPPCGKPFTVLSAREDEHVALESVFRFVRRKSPCCVQTSVSMATRLFIRVSLCPFAKTRRDLRLKHAGGKACDEERDEPDSRLRRPAPGFEQQQRADESESEK